MPAKDAMQALSQELDSVSYDWLVGAHPGLVDAIEAAVAQGIGPDAIKHAVLKQTGRIELALRCQQAARHAARMSE